MGFEPKSRSFLIPKPMVMSIVLSEFRQTKEAGSAFQNIISVEQNHRNLLLASPLLENYLGN